jgi:hypothetical protein
MTAQIYFDMFVNLFIIQFKVSKLDYKQFGLSSCDANAIIHPFFVGHFIFGCSETETRLVFECLKSSDSTFLFGVNRRACTTGMEERIPGKGSEGICQGDPHARRASSHRHDDA